MKREAACLVALAVAMTSSIADSERPNEPIVVAAESGYCYAKSIPDGKYGEAGTTQVFRAEKGADTLLQTYNWYARELYIDCLWPYMTPPDVSVVQVGAWPRGQTAKDETLAIAFYLDGQLLEKYSTLDIAGSPSNVEASVWHYDVFESVEGYRWGAGHQRFVAKTIDGRTLVFDSETGARVHDKVLDKPADSVTPPTLRAPQALPGSH